MFSRAKHWQGCSKPRGKDFQCVCSTAAAAADVTNEKIVRSPINQQTSLMFMNDQKLCVRQRRWRKFAVHGVSKHPLSGLGICSFAHFAQIK